MTGGGYVMPGPWVGQDREKAACLHFGAHEVTNEASEVLSRFCANCGGTQYVDPVNGPDDGSQGWVDRQGDVWRLGLDGLMHTRETAPFPREHVERKWGPLRPVTPPPLPEPSPLLRAARAMVDSYDAAMPDWWPEAMDNLREVVEREERS